VDVEVLRAGAEAIAAGRRPADAALFEAVRVHAVAALRAEQDLDLRAFGVAFDTYYLESSLYTDGRVDLTVRSLVEAGATYEQDGALFLRTTAYGDDKDRVMRRSAARGGDYTYFVPDVAYHVTKWARGYKRAINVQGSDHHGTTTRVRAGLQALGVGIPEGYPEYVLHQLVTVMRGGEEVKISKRAGSYVTVRDLIDWVGRDAVRYFYLMRRGDSHLVFDVDLARSESDENPVYRVQMAHARMCGIFRTGGFDAEAFEADAVNWALLAEPAEQELATKLVDFPRVVSQAAEALEPHRVAAYLLEAANLAHGWYHKHHVLGQEPPLQVARLALARAAQVVLRNGLAVLGISAPERM
jgi:arginyl-tRNA synthetase